MLERTQINRKTDSRDRNDPEAYYRFDDKAREVLIHRYDTPTPWMNYLSNGDFHCMMSQAGGAVAFYKSPQIWRINRYRFFHLPTDRSGVYYYIQDKETGEYWCPTAEPAFSKPETWRAAHGLGYTRFFASKNDIESELTYFVGEGVDALVGSLHIRNLSNRERKVSLFAFVEFGMMEFLRELSWICYNKHQLSVDFDKELQCINYHYNVEMQSRPEDTPRIYMASNYPLRGYDGDRDEFIGAYRSESNPYAIEHGGCTNSTLRGGDPCGALQMELTLGPGASKTVNLFLGAAQNRDEIARALANCRRTDFVEESLYSLKNTWASHLRKFQCSIPDKDAEREINTWNPYQAQRNFLFSRNISFYATGTFRGVGFRDTSQDAIAHASMNVDETKEKIRLLLSQQYQDGHANHYFFPEEGSDPVNRLHSDNHIWPILAVHQLIMEAGNLGFLKETVPFYDGGEASVFEHLKRSIAFTRKNMGHAGFPLMLTSDWNDMLYKVCREGKGESIWMAMFLGYALPKLAELASLLGEAAYASELDAFWKELKEVVNQKAWDGQWFRRAIMDNGDYIGTAGMDEAKLWLNAQSWAVLSGMIDSERSHQAMDAVAKHLDSPLGLKIIWPPIVTYPSEKDPLSHYYPGCGENGSVFCHANTWAIMAECLLGRPEKAWKYYRQLIPHVAMKEAGAWRYKAEPYAYASNLFGPESEKFGLANVSWLTGTAAWMYMAVTQHIIGIRPTWNGLLVDPCIPESWDSFSVTRAFRGKRFLFTFLRNGSSPFLSVDGQEVPGNIIGSDFEADETRVDVNLDA